MTAIVNTPTVQKQFSIESDIPYIDLHARSCANLDLDPLVAELGYRISGSEGPKTLPSALSSEDNLLQAMARISNLILHAQTKKYGIEIVNLVNDSLTASSHLSNSYVLRNLLFHLLRHVPNQRSDHAKKTSQLLWILHWMEW